MINKSRIVVGVICVLIAFLLYLQADIFINFPIADDFGAIINFNLDYLNTLTLSDKLTLLFSQNNDFKLVVLKLVDLTYLTIFDNVNLGHLRVFGYFMFLSTMFFLYKLGDFRKTNILYFLPVPLLMISFAYSEINAFAMESLSHFLVIFLALATFYFLFQTKYFVLAILCLFLGVFANGNGLLLIPLGALGLLFLKKYKHLVIWILASCVFLFLFFFNYNRGESTLNGSVFSRVAHVFPIYFGGIGGLESIKLNFVIGCIGIVATLYLFFFKKTYQTHLVLSLFILFFGGTYLLISAKREYTHPSEILRGAYLVNSIMIFVTLYVLSHSLFISKWLRTKQSLSLKTIAVVLLVCGIYQARNLTRWYGSHRYFLMDIYQQTFDMYANNQNLHKELEGHYNIPLVNTVSFHSAIQKGILNPSQSLNSFLAKPITQSLDSQTTDSNIIIELGDLNGQHISENPYISFSGLVQNYPVRGNHQLAICIEKNRQKDYYKIDLRRDKNALFRLKKDADLNFNCLINKEKYIGADIKLRVFTFEKNKITAQSKTVTLTVREAMNGKNLMQLPIVYSHKTIGIDSTLSPRLIEANTTNNISKLLINIPDALKDQTDLYLGFESTEDTPSFMFKLEADGTKPNQALCIFDQNKLNKLHPIDDTYILKLISTPANQAKTQYPLKSFFYIPSKMN
jgi:hypothetical protein